MVFCNSCAHDCRQADKGMSPQMIWEFPKIGDPNIAPYLVGSVLSGPPNKVPLIFGNSKTLIEPLQGTHVVPL